MARSLTLHLLPDHLSLVRLAAGSPLPDWADGTGFVAIVRTAMELSITCASERVPAGVAAVSGWRVLEVAGPFDLSETGVMAAIAGPLGAAEISLLPIASHDTDYTLIQGVNIDRAIAVLRAAGHQIVEPT